MDDGYLKGTTEPPFCCHKCASKMTEQLRRMHLNKDPFPLNATRMILCSECGNKRCPKASDHTLTCTHSNESGQPGSIYAHL